jgi:hypothetical protein
METNVFLRHAQRRVWQFIKPFGECRFHINWGAEF